MASATPLPFRVSRQFLELVPPAKPTPREFKPLSDIDSQEGLRFQVPFIFIYRKDDLMEGKDPVKVIREAISKALVFYYPFAGRLREINDGKKLAVDCTGEGIMFIEADADVSLEDFGDSLHPPFPCLEELLYDVPGSGGILNCPLMLVQVTRLKCGGFIFAVRFNHSMSDGTGFTQFLTAVGEIARGIEAPSVLPVWKRELLNSRVDQPPVHEHDVALDTKGSNITPSLDEMVGRYFRFGATEISALRRHVPPYLQNCTTFELLTACLWRCRTISISPDPHEEMQILYIFNARNRFNPPLPKGYYGNAALPVFATSTATNLMKKPLEHALEIVMKTKSSVTDEYLRSIIDQVALRRPWPSAGIYMVSDMRRLGFMEVDFGWRTTAYGGPARIPEGPISNTLSIYLPYKNNKGEDGIAVPISLPSNTMKVFGNEIETMTRSYAWSSRFIKSARKMIF